MGTKCKAIDEYLAELSAPKRLALRRLRMTIHEIIPKAEECISYRIPAFRFKGKVVVGFMATAKGCSYLPFSGSTLKTLAHELKNYGGTKSSLHFDPKKPLSKALVRKLIRVRIAEI
jgi:uncharacterized protein YdhG (YjbR/CyaY superfamily)